MAKLVADTRREIADVSAEPGWTRHWSDERHIPDYSRVRERLESLLASGHADAVVALGDEITAFWTGSMGNSPGAAWGRLTSIHILSSASPQAQRAEIQQPGPKGRVKCEKKRRAVSPPFRGFTVFRGRATPIASFQAANLANTEFPALRTGLWDFRALGASEMCILVRPLAWAMGFCAFGALGNVQTPGAAIADSIHISSSEKTGVTGWLRSAAPAVLWLWPGWPGALSPATARA